MSYHLQGAVPLNSEGYIERDFERSILDNALAGNWSTLLGPRQHGKTTSLIRIQSNLENVVGIRCVFIDLQRMPPPSNYESLIRWFAARVSNYFGQEIIEPDQAHDSGQLEVWLENVLPDDIEPIVIIIDEASAISNDEWRNSFYGQIRAIANERATAEDGDLAARLRFIFSGTFRPESLVRNQNSPFNVSEIVVTNDLTLQEAIQLYSQVEDEVELEFVELVYEVVGGHPYLLNFLFSRTQTLRSLGESIEHDDLMNILIDEAVSHLNGVFSPILADSTLTELVSQMVTHNRILFEPANSDYQFLQIIGVAKREQMFLQFRNRIYYIVASISAQIDPSLHGTNSRILIFVPEADSFNFMVSPQLREIAFSMEQGAARAYNQGNYRLALVGYGSTLEAVLIDWLLTLQPLDLGNAINAAQGSRSDRPDFRGREVRNSPLTWRLVNLIKVAKHVVTQINVDPSDRIREWRNIIHPSVALNDYLPDRDLEPESRAASGLVAALKRDVSAVI